MSDTRYHIIFSALIEGRPSAQVYHGLAELFKIDQERVRNIFACQGAVVKSDLELAAAEQYVQIILATGAICVIEPMPDGGSDVFAAEGSESDPKDISQPGSSPDRENSAEANMPASDQISQQNTLSPLEGADRVSSVFPSPVLAALLLLAGACLPVMSASGQLHWPWRFIFEPQPPGLLWWVVLPVAAAALLALLRAPAFSLLVAFVGAVTLLSCTMVFWEAALIVPLRILPFDRTAALVYVLPLLGAAICSAACSAMGELGELIMLRLLAACGSLAVFISACAGLFNDGAVWGRWPMILLLLLLLLYAVLVFVCACLPSVPEVFLHQIRLLGILLVCWAPVAVVLVHVPLSETETGRALFLAVLKAGLLYYGAIAAIVGGLRTEFLYRFEK